MNIETTQVVPSSASMSQVEALTAQLAAYVRFKETGEAVHAVEAARLSKISRIAIEDNGLIRAVHAATYVNEVFTENTGGGCMVDFIVLKDSRFVALNDEAIAVFSSVDSFYEDGGESALHSMWIEPAYKYALRSADSLRTDDGYVFKKQADGSYTDGDMSFNDLDSLFKQFGGRLSKVDALQAVEVQATNPGDGREDVAIAAPALRIKVSIDGGENFMDANQGVRIIYEGVSIPDEDEDGTAELHLHATHEGLITDILTTKESDEDGPVLGTTSQLIDDIVGDLVGAESMPPTARPSAIDWELLRKQKAKLVSMASEEERLTSEIEVLDGIVSLLDSIQDEAVESRRASESEVFGPDWVIYSPNESALSGDGAGFWSEADGWTTIGEAEHFDDADMLLMHLPVSTGSDAKWVPWSEVEKHYGGFAEDQLHKAGIDTLSPAIDHLRQND